MKMKGIEDLAKTKEDERKEGGIGLKLTSLKGRGQI